MTHSAVQKNQKAQIECLYPILKVKNLPASLAYYTKTLGFKEDWSVAHLAQVSRENFGIMLNQSSQVHPQEIWIGVERLEPFYEEYLQRGAVIHQEPTNHSWAYDMKIKDPDGHLLWIGSGPKSDEPYED
jgi:predicted lactoylglutathione lyase